MSGIKSFVLGVSGMAMAAVSLFSAAGLVRFVGELYGKLGLMLTAREYATVCGAATLLGTLLISGADSDNDRVKYSIIMTLAAVVCLTGLGSPAISAAVYAALSVFALISVALTLKKGEGEWLLFVGGALMSVISIAGLIGAVRCVAPDVFPTGENIITAGENIISAYGNAAADVSAAIAAAAYAAVIAASAAASVVLLRRNVFLLFGSMLSLAALIVAVWGFAGKSRPAVTHILISMGLSLAALIMSAVMRRTNPKETDADWRALDLAEFLSGVQLLMLLILAVVLLVTVMAGDREKYFGYIRGFFRALTGKIHSCGDMCA